MSESTEQEYVFRVLELNEVRHTKLTWIHASMNGASASSRAAAALRKRQGQKPGVSDICLPFWSHDRKYPGAYIEMKDGRGQPTPAQLRFLEFVENEGYFAAVAHGADEALTLIEGYCGIVLRGRK